MNRTIYSDPCRCEAVEEIANDALKNEATGDAYLYGRTTRRAECVHCSKNMTCHLEIKSCKGCPEYIDTTGWPIGTESDALIQRREEGIING